jgi:hypothetical protein
MRITLTIAVTMILLPEEKPNDGHPPSSSFVTIQYAPGGSSGRAPDSIRQQKYTPSSESPLLGDYDPELPPPAYESVPNIGNGIQSTIIPNSPPATRCSDAHTPGVDVKSEVTLVRESFADPSDQVDAPTDTQTTYEPLAGSGYARPPNVTEMIGAAASSAPPDYIVPPVRTNVYPHYSYPSSLSSPPLPIPPSRSLLSLVGGSASTPSQNQGPPLPPSFSRPPPHNLVCDTFPPIYLIANGKHLDDGFPVVPPPSSVQPHPFSSHDVREVDWIR